MMKNKKKVIVLIALIVLGGLCGYLETLVPAVVPSATFRFEFALIFALVAVCLYGYVEGVLVYGVRTVVFGIVLGNTEMLLGSLVCGLAALLFVWGLLMTNKLGLISVAGLSGIVGSLFYYVVHALSTKSVAVFVAWPLDALLSAVWYAVCATLAWLAVRFLPEKVYKTEE